MLIKVKTDEVSNKIPADAALLIVFASFEGRSTSLSKKIAKSFTGEVVILRNKPMLLETENNLNEILTVFHEKTKIVDVRIDSPVITIDQFSRELIPRISSSIGPVIIDTTTFTHEHLLILLYLLKRENLLKKIVFTYTGAEQYSTSEKIEDIWLSRGVKQIRSILGFPGELVPSKNLHLIIQVGFELERAQMIIESYEPRRLSLGFAPELMSITPELAEKNREFFTGLTKFVEHTRSSTTTVEHFEFSCVDPLSAKNSLLRQIVKNPDLNTVICPLNNKISTIGAALLAFDLPSIQLCYAEASIYNVKNYSTPGPYITIFNYLALGEISLEIK